MKYKDKIVWKDVIEYEGLYQINNIGQVKSNYKTKKLLTPQKDKDGYNRVFLFKNKKGQWHFIHRLILKTFVGDECNKIQVNHKNGVKDDNKIENLEWCTQSENQLHRCHVLNKMPLNPSKGKFGKDSKLSKKVNQYDIKNQLISQWDSLSDVHRKLNINIGCLSDCCNGKRKTAGGYVWRYCNE